jgi:dTDP-4-dehydrorhamnose 3,5-epimerase
MKFAELPLAGAYAIDLEPIADDRGFFARTWCERELAQRGLVSRVVQCNLSHNERRGTLRGMHYQAAPAAETKVVSCVRGAIYDVVVDLRPDSPTRGRWHAEELSEENHRALYIPEGMAHGFQTLTDGAAVFYMMSEFFETASARGVRWDDPRLGIRWPTVPTCISERDRNFPLLP